MSIESEISRIKSNISSAYTAVKAKGGTVPEEKTSANLPAAIRGIPQEGGGGKSDVEVLENPYDPDFQALDGMIGVAGLGAVFDIELDAPPEFVDAMPIDNPDEKQSYDNLVATAVGAENAIEIPPDAVEMLKGEATQVDVEMEEIDNADNETL